MASAPYHSRNSAVSVADGTLPGEELSCVNRSPHTLVPYPQLTK
jgi:hypothetical protein